MRGESESFRVLVGGEGREVKLAMESLWLTGRVLPVGARVVAVHRFRSAEQRPAEVVYAFGLPRDAALRRFKVEGEGFRVRSELRSLAEATAAYEAGIQGGHLSALSRVYRDGRVNLSLGNIRPGEVVQVYLEILAGVNLRDEGYRFRFPFTLAPCYHACARSAAVPGGMEMELPADEFSDLMLPSWLNEDGELHRVGFDLAVMWPGGAKAVGSPSHRVQVVAGDSGVTRVASAQGGDVPNRDLVVDVEGERCHAFCYGGEGCSSSAGGARSRAFVVAIPSTTFGESKRGPRNILFLLDRSGSMQGIALDQAKQGLLACLGALEAEDRFNLVAFDNALESFERKLMPATDRNRARARKFLKGIQARGGTELGPALRAALHQASGGQADVFVLTDGQVAATEDIFRATRDQSVRVHCLGIGSASQDRFLALLAEKAGGVSQFVMPRERVDTKALELFAAVGRCEADEVEADAGSIEDLRWVVAPKRQVFDGFPLLLWGEGRVGDAVALRLRWKAAGELREKELSCSGSVDTGTVRLLQGARLITSIEAQCGIELDGPKSEGREVMRWRKKLEEVGREYGLANRALSLVAVVERQGDDASQVPSTRVVPVGLPEDLAPDAYLGSVRYEAVGARDTTLCAMQLRIPARRRVSGRVYRYDLPGGSAFHRKQPDEEYGVGALSASDSSGDDPVVRLMGEVQADGGLSGVHLEARVLRTAAAVVWLRSEDHEPFEEFLRPVMERMIRFLRFRLSELATPGAREVVERVLEKVDGGQVVQGPMLGRVMRIAWGRFATVPDAVTQLGGVLGADAAP